MSKSIQEFLQKECWQTVRSLWDTTRHPKGQEALKAAPEILLEITEMLAESHRTLMGMLLEIASPATTPDRLTEVARAITTEKVDPDAISRAAEIANEEEAPPAPPQPITRRGLSDAFRAKSGRYGSGPYVGLYPLSSIRCATCGTRSQPYRAIKEGWPSPTLCAECQGKESTTPVTPSEPITPPEPREASPPVAVAKPTEAPETPTDTTHNRASKGLSEATVADLKRDFPWAIDEKGFVLEGPFEGLTLAQKVQCQSCRMTFRVYMAKHWATKDQCRDCRLKAEFVASASQPDPEPDPELPARVPTPSIAEERRKERATRAQYKNNVMAGLWPRSLVTCRECGRNALAYVGLQEGWPEQGLCPDHQKAGDPWAGRSYADMLTCSGCKQRKPMAQAKGVWPLPDFCDKCQKLTEPAPPAPEAPPATPMCAECGLVPPEPGAILCIACTLKAVDNAVQDFKRHVAGETPTEPVVETAANGTAANGDGHGTPNPFSKKRANPARGDENNWRTKRLAESLRRG